MESRDCVTLAGGKWQTEAHLRPMQAMKCLSQVQVWEGSNVGDASPGTHLKPGLNSAQNMDWASMRVLKEATLFPRQALWLPVTVSSLLLLCSLIFPWAWTISSVSSQKRFRIWVRDEEQLVCNPRAMQKIQGRNSTVTVQSEGWDLLEMHAWEATCSSLALPLHRPFVSKRT